MAEIFISYARADGGLIAGQIRSRLALEHPELSLWQDLVSMAGGLGWWNQVTEAIEQSHYVVLVMTPGAAESRIVRKEWQHARQSGVSVVPVMDERNPPDFGVLPRWMKRAHFLCLPAQWDMLVAQLKSPPQLERVPFMAEDLPEGFVARAAEFERVLAMLIKVNGDPVSATVALHGAGGFGKTTLALSVCHQDAVINAFSDGVLWATLGEKPNVVRELTKLYAALTGERPAFVDSDDAAAHLSARLAGKNCLVVIDDVWDPTHLKPFLRGGRDESEGCARLITTRDFAIAASAAKDARVAVEEMRPPEAAELLMAGLQASGAETFEQLARRLGEWPLLLSLTRGALRLRIARGESLERALNWVNEALNRKGFGAFDQKEASERKQAAALTLSVSMDLLTADERRLCTELAVFPEEVATPVSIIAELWGCSEWESREHLERFHNLSLLRFDLETGVVRMHSIMRQYLVQRLPNAAELHARLVRGWGDRYRLPSAYSWSWFAWHLSQSQGMAELKRLLLDFRWIVAKLNATDINVLISDYDLAAQDPECGMVRATLCLSAHVLARNKGELSGQLIGRLGSTESSSIREMLDTAARTGDGPWIRPLRASLTSPGALLRTLTGHTAGVEAVDLAGPGRAISAGRDGKLIVWNLETGAQVFLRGLERSWVTAATVIPGCRRVLLAVYGQGLALWDIDLKQQLRIFGGGPDWIEGIAATREGKLALSSASTLKVWAIESGELAGTLSGHDAWIPAVAVSPDGSFAVSASHDRTLKVWDLQTHRELRTLSGHTDAVEDVAVTPDGTRAISASRDCTLRVWDVDGGKLLRTLSGHASGVECVAVTPDGRLFVSGSRDETIRVWDSGTGAQIATLVGHWGPVRALRILPDGRGLISASDDGTLKVWNLDRAADRSEVVGHSGIIQSLAAAREGRLALSASWDGSIKIWDLGHCTEAGDLSGHSAGVTGLAVSPDGQRALSGAWDGVLKLWDLESARELVSWKGHSEGIAGVALSSDCLRAVSASRDFTLKVWDLTRSLCLHTFEHEDFITSVALSEDRRLAISASLDRTIRAWEIDSGRKLTELKVHSDAITAVALTPDGHVVSGSFEGTLRVSSLESASDLLTLPGHEQRVTCVVCAGRNRVFSASADQTVRVWDLELGREIARFHGDVPFRACAVAEGGRTVFAGDALGRVHFLRLEEDEGAQKPDPRRKAATT